MQADHFQVKSNQDHLPSQITSPENAKNEKYTETMFNTVGSLLVMVKMM